MVPGFSRQMATVAAVEAVVVGVVVGLWFHGHNEYVAPGLVPKN